MNHLVDAVTDELVSNLARRHACVVCGATEPLEELISRLDRVKNAQVEGSDAWQTLQREINDVTARWLDAKAKAQTIARVDVKIAEADREVQALLKERAAKLRTTDQTSKWFVPSGWAGGLAALLLLIGLLFGLPPLLWGVCAVLAAAGGAGVYLGVQKRRTSDNDLAEIEDDLDLAQETKEQLQDQRRDLVDSVGQSQPAPAPLPTQPVTPTVTAPAVGPVVPAARDQTFAPADHVVEGETIATVRHLR